MEPEIDFDTPPSELEPDGKIDPYDIVFDPDIYPRDKPDPDIIARYAELMDEGHEFPPVRLEKGSYRVLDGWHTASGAKKIGKDVEYVLVDTENRSPLLLSARFNSKHGDPLDMGERKNIARKLVGGEDFDGDFDSIASQLGVLPSRVKQWTEDIRDSKEMAEREKIEKELQAGTPIVEICRNSDKSVEEIEQIEEEMDDDLEPVKSIEQERRRETESAEEKWDEVGEEEASGSEKDYGLKCPYCGGARFRLVDEGGTRVIQVDERGDGRIDSVDEGGVDEGYFVSCAMCGEDLASHRDQLSETDVDFYSQLIKRTEELAVADEDEDVEKETTSNTEPVDKAEEEDGDSEPDEENSPGVTDEDLYAEYGLVPNGTNGWASGVEAMLNLMYHFTEPGDLILDLFSEDKKLLDLGQQASRQVISYDRSPERDEVRQWNGSQFEEDVVEADTQYDFVFWDRRFIDDDDARRLLDKLKHVSDQVALLSDPKFYNLCELEDALGDWGIEHRIFVMDSKRRKAEFRGDIEEGFFKELLIINKEGV